MSPHPTRRRVAVVGTGSIVSGSHLPALTAHADRAEPVAAVDVDQARLDAFRELAGGQVAGYTSVQAMLDTVRPDLVLVGTPPSLCRARATLDFAAALYKSAFTGRPCTRARSAPATPTTQPCTATPPTGPPPRSAHEHPRHPRARRAHRGRGGGRHRDPPLRLPSAIHESHWFVRAEPIPTAAFSWAFFEEFELPPGESFAYRYRIVFADGAWDADRVAAHLEGLPW